MAPTGITGTLTGIMAVIILAADIALIENTIFMVPAAIFTIRSPAIPITKNATKAIVTIALNANTDTTMGMDCTGIAHFNIGDMVVTDPKQRFAARYIRNNDKKIKTASGPTRA